MPSGSRSDPASRSSAAARSRRDPGTEADGATSLEFAGDVVTGDALAILLFAGPVAFSFGVETGWRCVGPRATVTRTSAAGVLEIDGRPALEFYERYLGTGQPPVANPLAVFEAPGSDRFYLRTPMTYDRDRGSISFFGAVPEGASVQLTMAGTDEIVEGARASIADALAGFPAGARPDGALLFSCATRKFLLGTRAGREIELVREILGDAVPIGGLYCHGRDRADGVGRPDPVPQRHDGLGPARVPRRRTGPDRLDGRACPADASSDELEKENRRLTRRLERLEANVRRLEEFQDSNSTLAVAAAHRARGGARDARERLLLNVLPQRIIDRLAAGETLIADRHESVSVLFSDVVGFTGISARLAPADLIEELNGSSPASTRSASGPASRRSRRSATPTWSIGGLDGRPDHATAIAETALQMIEQVEARPGSDVADPDRPPRRAGRRRGDRHDEVRL